MILAVKSNLSSIKAVRRLVAVSLFFLFAGLAAGCGDGDHLLRWSGPTMGTAYNITVSADPREGAAFDLEAMRRAVDDKLAEINSQMSTYDTQSELSRFNQLASGQCKVLSAPLAEVIALSFKVHAASEGAFDITVGPLVNRWGFGPDQSSMSFPTEQEIQALKARVGMQWLDYREEKRELCKQARVEIDLSAIAKGYAVDQVAAVLESFGANNYLVDIGGEVRTRGSRPRGGPWRLAIEKPAMARGSAQALISVSDAAVATSGDYRNYRDVDGKRFSHTIDPRNGYPVRHNTASVTVIAKTAAEADAWATALNTLGFERAKALAAQYQLAIYLLQRLPPEEKPDPDSVTVKAQEFASWHSSSFERYIIPD